MTENKESKLLFRIGVQVMTQIPAEAWHIGTPCWWTLVTKQFWVSPLPYKTQELNGWHWIELLGRSIVKSLEKCIVSSMTGGWSPMQLMSKYLKKGNICLSFFVAFYMNHTNQKSLLKVFNKSIHSSLKLIGAWIEVGTKDFPLQWCSCIESSW